MEPNENLREAYLKKAEDALQVMRTVSIRDWKVTAAYYAMYFSLYAILMRIGVKCEIHLCTLLFMKTYLSDHFNDNECSFLKQAMSARIDSQYYVGRTLDYELYDQLLRRPPGFIAKCKSVLLHLTERDILDIRKRLLG